MSPTLEKDDSEALVAGPSLEGVPGDVQQSILWRLQWLRSRVRELERQKSKYQKELKALEEGQEHTKISRVIRKPYPSLQTMTKHVPFFAEHCMMRQSQNQGMEESGVMDPYYPAVCHASLTVL